MISTNNCEYASGSDGTTRTTIKFSIRENTINPTIPNLPHKLQGLLCAEAQPPSTVKRVTLSGIYLCLDFDWAKGEKNAHLIEQLIRRIDSTDVCIIGSQLDIPKDEVLETWSSPECDHILTSVISETPPTPSQVQLNWLGRHQQSSSDQWGSSTLWGNEYSDKECNIPFNKNNIGLCRLLGVCFDDIFLSTRSNLDIDICIKSVKERTIYKLSDIAPTIFFPGYREVSLYHHPAVKEENDSLLYLNFKAMQQRACFIPVLAKAISSMIEGTGTSNPSRRLSSLQEYYASHYETDLNTHGSLPSTRSIVKCLLWELAQKSDYCTKTVRKPRYACFADLDNTSPSAFDSLFMDENLIRPEWNLSDNEMGYDDDSVILLEEELSSLCIEDMDDEESFVETVEVYKDQESADKAEDLNDNFSVFFNKMSETVQHFQNRSISSSEILDYSDEMLRSEISTPVLPSSPLSFHNSRHRLADNELHMDMLDSDPFEPDKLADNNFMLLDKPHMELVMHGEIDEEMLPD